MFEPKMKDVILDNKLQASIKSLESKHSLDNEKHGHLNTEGIYFLEDWKKYPRAIVHYKTKNLSFLDLANTLHNMGIKNHLFFLSLLDPDLEDVDPHDPNLSIELIAKIVIECKRNPWYFFREVLKAPPSSGLNPTPFLFNRASLATIWAFINEVTPFLIQPRQTGKSFLTFGFVTYLLTIGVANTNINMLTKDNTLRAESMVTLKKLMHVLPPYLRLKDKKDLENTEKLTVRRKKNSFRMLVARASAEDADGVGRGLTSPFILVDEIAYFRNIGITLPIALSSSGAARDSARANNSLYGFLFATTAGKLHTKSGKYAYSIYKASTKWTEQFYDCKNKEEFIRTVKLNSPSARGKKAPTVVLDYNHLQLGKTDEWLKERIALSASEGVDAETDYLNRWVSGSDKGLLTKEEIEAINSGLMRDYESKILNNGYILRIYDSKLTKNKDIPYIIGIDTSDAAGNDAIGITIRDPKTGSVVATGEYNETNLTSFAEYIASLLEYFSKSTLIIERKSSAIGIIDHITTLLHYKGMDPFKRIFNRAVEEVTTNQAYKDMISTPLGRRGLEVYTKYKKVFGFTTTGSGRYARSNLYGHILKNAVRYTGKDIHDQTIITQMSNLIVKNGRVDHANGEHDDILFSYLLTQWFLINANNKELYGIDPMTVLLNVGNKKAKEEDKELQEQMEITKEITALAKKLTSEEDPSNHYLMYKKLEKLKDKVDPSVYSTMNMDASLVKNKLSTTYKQQFDNSLLTAFAA